MTALTENADPNRAIADYTEGIRLDARSTQIYYRRAEAHLRRGAFMRSHSLPDRGTIIFAVASTLK